MLTAVLLSNLASGGCNLNYNANGSLMIDTQCNHYQYNAKEQLIAIKSPKRGLQCNYTYSPEGLRDAKTCRSSDNQHMQLDFIYQNNQLINAEDRQHNSQSAYLGKDVRYVVNAFKQNAYYFSAAVHSTTSLLLTATANLKQTYNFSSYGQNRLFVQNNPSRPINFSQPLTYNPLTYDGEYQDPETGFVYLRARFYNPRQLRFMQRDNYNLLNRYNAFDDNPVSNIDPSGHLSFSKLVVAGSKLVVAGTTYISMGVAALMSASLITLPIACFLSAKFYLKARDLLNQNNLIKASIYNDYTILTDFGMELLVAAGAPGSSFIDSALLLLKMNAAGIGAQYLGLLPAIYEGKADGSDKTRPHKSTFKRRKNASGKNGEIMQNKPLPVVYTSHTISLREKTGLYGKSVKPPKQIPLAGSGGKVSFSDKVISPLWGVR